MFMDRSSTTDRFTAPVKSTECLLMFVDSDREDIETLQLVFQELRALAQPHLLK